LFDLHTMSNGGSLINLGDISKPATVLVEKISEAIGGVFKPYQIRRIAEAEAQADRIREVSRIEVTDLQRRALHRFIHEEAQRQANIESITQKALPEVSQDAKPQDIQNDWISNFFDQCRLISDEEMQRLWARVLAGEANCPGSYSKRTIGLLSSLDKSDAELFKTLCSFGWFFGGVLPLIYDVNEEIYKKPGLTFGALTHLNDIGLIRFESIVGFSGRPLSQKVILTYYGTPVAVEFPKPDGNTLDFGHAILSKSGQELAPLCDSAPQPQFLDYVVEKWRKKGLKVEIRNVYQGAPAPANIVATSHTIRQ
jgi:hypothetical protein